MATVSEQSPTPKLSLFSLPSKPDHEPPGMLTPPLHTLASVPFKWEEVPGKPRPCDEDVDNTISNTLQPKPAEPVRCLELPPRLLNEAARVSNLPSPTTVLDGPYVGRSRSLSFGTGRSVGGSDKVVFGSTRWWGNPKKNNKEVVVGVGFDFSSNDEVDDGGGNGGGATKVKITRIRRRSSSLSYSGRRSHLLTMIYQSLKQVVPWKCRQEKLTDVSLAC